jgi:signal transduction histidine kinase
VAVLAQTIGAQYAGSAHAKGLKFDVAIAGNLPLIETDATRVREIIGNLLSNAIKYTDGGSVRLRVARSAGPHASANLGVSLEVIDTGPGIPLDKQTLIFEEFSRLGGVAHSGAGLGLSISKLLAEALGGFIGVESVVGAGSTFTLWIPATGPKRPDDAVAAQSTEACLDAAIAMRFPASDPLSVQ